MLTPILLPFKLNKSFEIKMWTHKIQNVFWHSKCVQENLNSLETIYFKGRPSMCPYYAEAAQHISIILLTILLFFSHMSFTHEKISHASNLTWHFLNYWNVHQKNNILAKNQHSKTFTNFSTQNVASKFRTEFSNFTIS